MGNSLAQWAEYSDNKSDKVDNALEWISAQDLYKIRQVVEWKSNVILCDCWNWAKIFNFFNKLDRSNK